MIARPLWCALLAFAVAACGGGREAIEHPQGADELVLRVVTGGGLVPPEYALRELPGFSLYGDGRLVVRGPEILIYPGPALPNLVQRQVGEEGVQALLAAADEAGLLGPSRHYDFPGIADAPTTTFTVVADGEQRVVSAYALGLEAPGQPGVSEEENQARAALLDFSTKLGDLPAWLPAGSLGAEEPYVFDELRVYVRPYTASPEPGLVQAEKRWPLAAPLAAFGQPVEDLPDTRCGVVMGEELATLLPAAQESSELTPWTSEGSRYLLLFRPLLPDEHGC
jgi:hypothetical protein